MGPTVFKQLIWLSAAALLAGNAPYAPAAPQAYAIEPARTVVSFEVRNLGIAKRRGLFGSVSGRVLLDAQAGNGSIDIVVNAQSVETSDPATRAFLRGRSFLNVEQYSQIIYRAERVVFEQDRPVRIDGELTLLGVTKSVSLLISGYTCEGGPSGASRCVLDAATTFRRSDFGMNHYMALVSDDVRLAIHGVTTGAL
jgi:polyisoprenoid-binding protein YceI